MTRRLLASYLMITVLVLVVLEIPLGVFFQQRELDRLTADTERDATVLTTAFEDALEGQRTVDPFPADAYAERTGVRVVVTDARGISVVDTGNDTGRDFSTRGEFIEALQGERSTGTRRSDTLDRELLYVAVPIASGGVVHGALRLTLDTHEITERIHSFWWGLAGIAALVLAMVVAIGWATARSISRPILQLEKTAVRFSSGDLSPSAPVDGAPPEIERLADAMSTMAQQLDRLLVQQRSFVADASHQLRTPLTALRLRLENIEATVPGVGLAEEVAATIAETDRLGVLVNDLLQMAAAERPSTPIATPLRDVVSDRVETWGALAEQSGVALTLEQTTLEQTTLEHAGALPEAGETIGDVLAVPGAVEQMLDNLIDNALHAFGATANRPGDPEITVSLAATEQGVSLCVGDNGPGLDAEQRTHAAERFWRGAEHGAAVKTVGSGLGLSIVKSLADASGATFELSSNSSGGLSATITFRYATADPPVRSSNLARGPRRDVSKR